MTLYHFNLLPYEAQLGAVYATGSFLATRWQAEHESVNLYELPGRFLVELTYDGEANAVIDLCSFRSGPRLENYAVSVRLPDWLPRVE